PILDPGEDLLQPGVHLLRRYVVELGLVLVEQHRELHGQLLVRGRPTRPLTGMTNRRPAYSTSLRVFSWRGGDRPRDRGRPDRRRPVVVHRPGGEGRPVGVGGTPAGAPVGAARRDQGVRGPGGLRGDRPAADRVRRDPADRPGGAGRRTGAAVRAAGDRLLLLGGGGGLLPAAGTGDQP